MISKLNIINKPKPKPKPKPKEEIKSWNGI